MHMIEFEQTIIQLDTSNRRSKAVANITGAVVCVRVSDTKRIEIRKTQNISENKKT